MNEKNICCGSTIKRVGDKAPDFNLNAATGDGQGLTRVSLEDYKGKWLVLFFYPADFTFVCPTEITGYSKRTDDFKKLGAELLAASVDSEYSHQAWINGDLGKINFPIASDMTKEIARELGILLEDDGIALRGLFIIDPKGIIRYSVVHDLNVGRSVDETLRVLAALQNGGMCPIDWLPGEDTL